MNHGMGKIFLNGPEKATTVGAMVWDMWAFPLPLLYDAGFRVWGVDISQHTVDTVLKEKIQQVTLTSTISFPNRVLSVGISPPRQAKQSTL